MPEFFNLRPPVVVVEEDRTARREHRRHFEQSLDRYVELRETLDKKLALNESISWDEESEFVSVCNELLKSVIVIGCWQLGIDNDGDPSAGFVEKRKAEREEAS